MKPDKMRAGILLLIFAILAGCTAFAYSGAAKPMYAPEAAAAPEETAEPTPAQTEAPKLTPSPEDIQRLVVVTEHKAEHSERFLWAAISLYSPSDVITAGVMAYFWRESQLRSDATAGWAYDAEFRGIDRPSEFVAMIDAGLADGSTRALFLEQAQTIGGFGLGQWYARSYLEAFYDFAAEWGTSIADAEMQCAFMLESLRENADLWEQLQEADDPAYAGRLIARLYDGVTDEADYFGLKAREFYEKYGEEDVE